MEEIKKIERSGGKLGKAILTLSTKFTEDIGKKLQHLEEKFGNLENLFQDFYNDQLDPGYKLVDLEDRSRRGNLRIDVVQELRAKCGKSVKSQFKPCLKRS